MNVLLEGSLNHTWGVCSTISKLMQQLGNKFWWCIAAELKQHNFMLLCKLVILKLHDFDWLV